MGLCSSCPHPGGEKLTRRMAALSCFRPGQQVLDLGCGDGATIRLLRDLGVEALGLETDPAHCGGERVLHYDGREFPFPDASFDGAVAECVLSCAEDPAAALRELRRVLKPEGTLALSDLVSRCETGTVPFSPGETGTVLFSPLHGGEHSPSLLEDENTASPLLTAEEYRTMFRQAGFTVYYEEDASDGLLQLFGQLLLDGGEEAVQKALGLTRQDRKRLRPGYHLWILVPDRYLELAEQTKDLPFTAEEALTGSRPRLLSAEPKDIARIITVDTSGSTGEKKRIYFTDEDLQRTADFFTTGMAPMIREGDRVTVFMRGTGTYSIAGLLKIAVERLGGSVENYGEIRDLAHAAAAAEGADCLVMLPGDAAALAALYPGLRPKSVLLSADYIPQAVTQRVTRAWNCRLFRHWGMTETGYGGAVTSEAEGPYLLRRDLFAEIADPESGRRLPFGEQGEIVITTVGREGMPFTRYRTGDLGRLVIDINGRPGLTDLRGRLSDEVPLPCGRSISIHLLDELLYQEPDLVWYEAALGADGTLKIGWQGIAAQKAGAAGSEADASASQEPKDPLPARLDKRIKARFADVKTLYYPALFRTGKRKLRRDDEDRSDL
ncbi:MAG: methyltransferase domain-containing protein [Lachnospiraceae bacterium]|nr:methyltransferase domain-containing protein [Lachnospiraceae bacterium]